MGADLTIRRYEPADNDRVWELHEQALRAADIFEDYDHDDGDLATVTETYLDGTGDFLVGVHAGVVVAMGGFRPHDDPGTAVLRRMRVDPAHQGNGYGSAILWALEDRIATAGFERVVLDTTSRQTTAHAFYRGHGYERFRSVDAGAFDIYHFEKSL